MRRVGRDRFERRSVDDPPRRLEGTYDSARPDLWQYLGDVHRSFRPPLMIDTKSRRSTPEEYAPLAPKQA